MQTLDDDQEYLLPPSYKINELSTVPRPECLIEIDKSTISLFDGDGGEVCMYKETNYLYWRRDRIGTFGDYQIISNSWGKHIEIS